MFSSLVNGISVTSILHETEHGPFAFKPSRSLHNSRLTGFNSNMVIRIFTVNEIMDRVM